MAKHGKTKTNGGGDHGYPADYEVGYRRPPVHTRFKPGVSGNRKGRPKGRKKMRAVLDAVLNELVTLREGDRTRKVTKAEAMVRAFYQRAVTGDAKAFSTIMSLCQQSGEFENEPIRIERIETVIIDPMDKVD